MANLLTLCTETHWKSKTSHIKNEYIVNSIAAYQAVQRRIFKTELIKTELIKTYFTDVSDCVQKSPQINNRVRYHLWSDDQVRYMLSSGP